MKKINILIFFTAILLTPFSAFAKNSQTPLTSTRCNQFTFDATSTNNSDNPNVKYHWDFGDGTSSNESVADHTYAKPGDYNVTLTVDDSLNLECSRAQTTQKVRANLSPHAEFSAPDIACIDQPITLDASSSTAGNTNKLSYEWNLGDGTKISNQKKINKTYNKAGDYKISLTVDDNQQSACSKNSFEKTLRVNQAPVAQAGDDVILKCVSDDNDLTVNFDGSSSYDKNKDELTYLWDFGDGTKEEGAKVSHHYKEVGAYEAKLIVKDPSNIGCQTGVDFVSVRLNQAPKANAGEDIVSCSGQDILFDGSDSSQYQKGSIFARWLFGDGQSMSGLRADHVYSKPGKYQATLVLESNLNAMCPQSKATKQININSAPTVTLKAPSSVCTGSAVSFEAASHDADNDTLTYHWSFGDGETSIGSAKMTHEYKQGGHYTVTVIVDDGLGSVCSTALATTTVNVNTPPVADMGPNLSCCVEKEVSFNASASTDADGDSLTYLWDFGDGMKTAGAVTKHAYKQSGQYNVTLTVNDSKNTSCSTSTANFTANVNKAPVAVINIR